MQKTNKQPKQKILYTFKCLGKPSKSLETIITTFSFPKNQNKYLPHFKCPLKIDIVATANAHIAWTRF